MGRPLLMLDVDGVLNPYGSSPAPTGYLEYDLFPGEEPIRVNRSHGQWIAGLLVELDVVWATGWNADANRVLAPLLGIPALPVLPMPPRPFRPEDKVAIIDRFVGGRPAAWIDDAHPPTARRWAAHRTSPTLLVAVDPASGLALDQVDRVRAWARAIPAG